MPAWGRRFAGKGRKKAEQKALKLAYFLIAAILGIGIAAAVDDMQILKRLKATVEPPLLAAVINGLVLMGGADVVQTLLGYLEDRRRIRVQKSSDLVDIAIINRHEGPVEAKSAGKSIASRPVRAPERPDKWDA